MSVADWVVIVCGILALIYGLVATRQVLSADAGTARMQEIAAAVQEGASAYLNRQYRAISIVGVVILIILGVTLGIRVAIGATRARIFGLVYRRVGAMLAVGIAAGAVATWAARRLLGAVVTLQPEHDAAALLGLAGIFVAVALLAALLPARRAATVDPMTSLRAE